MKGMKAIKSTLTAAWVICCAGVLSAQALPAATSQAGARTTAPGALTGSRTPGTPNPEPEPGTPNPEPRTSSQPGTPNPEPGTSSQPGTSSSLASVQALYGSAAYEDALAAMPAPGAAASRDIEQYRALCLMALGRQNEAAAAVDRITAMDPLSDPGSDTPPRLRAMYTEARVRLAPGLAKEAYADAKAAWEKKDVNAAHTAFQRTLDVIAVVPDPAAAGLTDLRELASGFLQLAAATAAANPAPASRPPAAARPPAAITESAPAAESGGAAAPPGESAAVSDEPFSGPVAIRQDMPGWQPPDAMARRQEYHGVVHLMIDATGRVEDVRVIKASHPSYDAAVVRAARQWAFTPASRGGRPVASEKDIEVFLRPQ